MELAAAGAVVVEADGHATHVALRVLAGFAFISTNANHARLLLVLMMEGHVLKQTVSDAMLLQTMLVLEA